MIDRISLSNIVLPSGLIRKIPSELIKRYQFIPIGREGSMLKVVFAELPDANVISEIELAIAYKINVSLASKNEIQSRLNELFPEVENQPEPISEPEPKPKPVSRLSKFRQMKDKEEQVSSVIKTETEHSKNPDLLLSILSFLIPIFGLIAGVIFIARPEGINKRTGHRCLKYAIAGFISACIIIGMIWGIAVKIEKRRVETTSNEFGAYNSLRMLVSSEAAWWVIKATGTPDKTFWTYDVSCFHRMFRANSVDKWNFIKLDFAEADAAPAKDNTFGEGKLAEIGAPTPRYGYFFRAMLKGDGMPYNQIEVNGIKAANKDSYAFVAYPAEYGKTGIHTFIVNESGTVYAIDTGSDEKKIVLQWPGSDPTQVKGPGGKNWGVADPGLR
jgi:hypothetical protein